ncbi:MAG: hypothetical protein K2O34_10915, partial [Acetatifactor sp.]|nr:hypothetical protein [Acetatifactor sp.]
KASDMHVEVSLLVGKEDIQNWAASDIVVIAIRGLGNCYLFSLIQCTLLKYFDEAKCFGIMSLGALLLTFFNPFELPFIAEQNFIYELSFWIIFYLVLGFLATSIIRKIFIKECTHGDRSI